MEQPHIFHLLVNQTLSVLAEFFIACQTGQVIRFNKLSGLWVFSDVFESKNTDSFLTASQPDIHLNLPAFLSLSLSTKNVMEMNLRSFPSYPVDFSAGKVVIFDFIYFIHVLIRIICINTGEAA